MPDPDPCPELRAQIRALQVQRRSVESKLLQPQAMRAGSMVERHLGTGGKSRTRPAYYVSRSQQGRSKLTYVKKEELAGVQQQCAAYRAFQQNLKIWRQLTAALVRAWRQLQLAQCG
jgi:type IV secretory pathway VirD2 relaxase